MKTYTSQRLKKRNKLDKIKYGKNKKKIIK